MRTIGMDKLISKGVSRTVLILFKPFSLKKWFLFLLIAFLSGSLGGGGNVNINTPSRRYDIGKFKQKYSSTREHIKVRSEEGYSRDELHDIVQDEKMTGLDDKPFWQDIRAKGLAGVFIFIGIFFLGVIVFFYWLFARFQFVWLDAIVNNDASIVKPFIQHKLEGNSLFKAYLVLFLALILFLGLIGLWGYYSGLSAGVFESAESFSFIKALKAFTLPLLTLGIGMVAFVLLGVCIAHFIVTIMGMENCRFLPAWQQFVEIFNGNKKDFMLYFLLLIGLGIASGIIIVFLAFICLVLLLLVGSLLFGIPYLLIGFLLKANILFIIYAVIVGIPFVLAAFVLLASLSLPVAVFFRAFSLYFVSSLNCGYHPLPLDTD